MLPAGGTCQTAYDQRATSSKWFNNYCWYIKALDEGSISPHLRTPVSSSASPVHDESNGGKQNLASWCGCPAVNKERGQRFPGFSCQGRLENSLLYLRSRRVPVRLSCLREKPPPHLTTPAGLWAKSKWKWAFLVLFGVWVRKVTEKRATCLRDFPWGLQKELLDDDF